MGYSKIGQLKRSCVHFYAGHLLRSLIFMCRVYLDNCLTDESHGSHLKLTGLTLRLHGATVVNALTDDVSHAIVDSR